MLMLPLPMVVAIVLLTLLATNREALAEDSTGRAFTVVLCLYAASLCLISIRWVWGVLAVLPLAAALSLLCVVLLYLAFASLGREGPAFSLQRDALHLLPFAALLFATLFFPPVAEMLFIALHVFYGVLLIRLALNWPESLRLVRLGRLVGCYQALWVAAILSMLNAVLEAAIAISFMFYEGRYAAMMVSYANIPILFLLGTAAIRAGTGRALQNEREDAVSPQGADSAGKVEDFADLVTAPAAAERRSSLQTSDGELSNLSEQFVSDEAESEEVLLMRSLDALLVDQKLYSDTELNLARLARKAGVPARKVSRTINAQTGLNVSQWVNKARIAAAGQLLENGQCTVNEAMLEVGFMTRSNFYREFRRVFACSPGEWRDQHGAAVAAQSQPGNRS